MLRRLDPFGRRPCVGDIGLPVAEWRAGAADVGLFGRAFDLTPAGHPFDFSPRRRRPRPPRAPGTAPERWPAHRRDRRRHRCGVTRSCSNRRARRCVPRRTSRRRPRSRCPPAIDRFRERARRWADRGGSPTATARPLARWCPRRVRPRRARRRASRRDMRRRPVRRTTDERPRCPAALRGTGPRAATSAARANWSPMG